MAQNQEQQVTMTMQWKSPIRKFFPIRFMQGFLLHLNSKAPIVSIAEQDAEKGVRLCVGDVDIFIESHDLDDGKKYEWPDAIERLKEVGKETFNKHQSYFIAAFKDEINEKMREISGKELDGYYWSSTEGGSGVAWFVSFSDGYINYFYKYDSFTVRPCAAFKKN